MTKHWTVLTAASLALLLALFGPAPLARADIYKWEYINPANPGLGKHQSTMLTPDGAGVNAAPDANLSGRNLTMAYLIGAQLSGAHARHTNLTNAEMSHANLTNAFFTGETEDDYFVGSNLNGANLSEANLTSVSLGTSTLINANLSQANLTGAYLAGNIFVSGGDEGGVAYFPGTDLTDANLSGANLTNANFSGICYLFDCALGANFYGANLTRADARGSDFYLATLTGANTNNLIQSDGHVAGLDLASGASLVVRDYDGHPAAPSGRLPIVIDQHLTMDTSGTLRLVFDADPWDSTISFAPGISVALGGTLELAFAPGVNIATQSGRTFDLFDWTGVSPIGAFTISSPYAWNISNLYTTGEVTLAAAPSLPGDYNSDGTVDAGDYVVWRKHLGTSATLPNDNTPGSVTQDDYDQWRSHFGQVGPGSGAGVSANAAVPEPATLVLLMIAAASWHIRRHRAA